MVNCSQTKYVLNWIKALDYNGKRFCGGRCYPIFQRFSSFRKTCSSQNNNYSTSRYFHVSTKCNSMLLSPQDVNVILRSNEFTKEFSSGSVKAYDSNQLASNQPIEDMRCEAHCTRTTGLLVGVFDGHGGAACAQVTSKRLFNYIAASLLPTQMLKTFANSTVKGTLLQTYNDKLDIVDDIKYLYEESFKRYVTDLMKTVEKENFDMQNALERAFLRLDKDLSVEVIDPYTESGKVNSKTLSVALSGAVVCISHIDGPHLHVANVGDSNAVMGVLSENNDWIAKKITKEHNSENYDELNRIWSEHPSNEKKTVIRRDRLLGELAPLRSIGDYRYKWPAEVLSKMVVPLVGPNAIPSNYHTPPYLSARPEIFYHRLTPKDKFLILASDGLWDMMTPLQAVKLVGEHMQGKVFFSPLKLPRKNLQLGDINDLLLHRKESLKSKPKDRNAATHLLRHAVGGTEYGVDHARLSHLLSLPSQVSRMFRDDITITVVYFDSEYLRNCPA